MAAQRRQMLEHIGGVGDSLLHCFAKRAIYGLVSEKRAQRAEQPAKGRGEGAPKALQDAAHYFSSPLDCDSGGFSICAGFAFCERGSGVRVQATNWRSNSLSFSRWSFSSPPISLPNFSISSMPAWRAKFSGRERNWRLASWMDCHVPDCRTLRRVRPSVAPSFTKSCGPRTRKRMTRMTMSSVGLMPRNSIILFGGLCFDSAQRLADLVPALGQAAQHAVDEAR